MRKLTKALLGTVVVAIALFFANIKPITTPNEDFELASLLKINSANAEDFYRTYEGQLYKHYKSPTGNGWGPASGNVKDGYFLPTAPGYYYDADWNLVEYDDDDFDNGSAPTTRPNKY
ncbi:hypothetical protein [Tamlana crocina]|uniref:Uncharacterized protein n=1 Tax=Tamlana crocina TaxID=393006 RepID=A0ABX1DF30_9FLAO|nr:hypothetical protein [Tamlana crocina]NJX16042.1 hypothetical protein [Tamlana crocina]